VEEKVRIGQHIRERPYIEREKNAKAAAKQTHTLVSALKMLPSFFTFSPTFTYQFSNL